MIIIIISEVGNIFTHTHMRLKVSVNTNLSCNGNYVIRNDILATKSWRKLYYKVLRKCYQEK
jgi:hypothetical protein